jgi:hypothetical protein
LQVLSNVVFAIALVVMAAVSIRFGGRVTTAMLPMQWSISGEPTWFAPRLVALWFSVGIAVGVRLVILLMEVYNPKKLHETSIGLILFSVIIAVVHIGHMMMAERWAARQ